ncbi:hypothetical protein EVAR_56168_1 [Eumeta japonica]|uniref:Uncharacterized protein n=1 Tax=Eumeta variegata TaxID=151549 RepID=A0A4C1Y2R5_EUMVA|nr:hypothetical protein EVAR_56168_1 [Eumeta japonica]
MQITPDYTRPERTSLATQQILNEFGCNGEENCIITKEIALDAEEVASKGPQIKGLNKAAARAPALTSTAALCRKNPVCVFMEHEREVTNWKSCLPILLSISHAHAHAQTYDTPREREARPIL